MDLRSPFLLHGAMSFFRTFLCSPLVSFGFKRFWFVPYRFWSCFSRFAIQETEKIGKIDKINKIDRTEKIDKIDKIEKIDKIDKIDKMR